MNYQQLWSTPIGKVQIDLPENIRKTVIQQVIFNYNRRTEAKEPIPSFMDLFDYTQYVGDEEIDVFKAVYRFELIISKIIRSFVEQAWGMNEKAELIKGKLGNHSLSISEAIYMGCPVIISDKCGSYGETDDVQVNKNGFVFECENVVQLKSYIHPNPNHSDV